MQYYIFIHVDLVEKYPLYSHRIIDLGESE